MSTPKRQRQPDQARPVSTAGQPTISVRAEQTAQSLAAERQALTARRAKLAGAVALPVVAWAAGTAVAWAVGAAVAWAAGAAVA